MLTLPDDLMPLTKHKTTMIHDNSRHSDSFHPGAPMSG
jgi:hypothetical protein